MSPQRGWRSWQEDSPMPTPAGRTSLDWWSISVISPRRQESTSGRPSTGAFGAATRVISRRNFKAARKGVANKIRDYSELVIALDDKYENAGGHRVLGRLHTEAPRIPLITGWVDRDVAISELERAVEAAPNDLRAHLFLTEALLKFDARRHDEAMDRLQWLVQQSPNSELVVEEIQVIEEAKLLLAEYQE